MADTQVKIDQLKEEFQNLTGRNAEEHPADFNAYLHLLQHEQLDQLQSYLEISATIGHRTTWAEMKNHLDGED